MGPREQEGPARRATQQTSPTFAGGAERTPQGGREGATAGHLSCKWCRIRMRASGPGIDLLEARCPICEAALAPAAASSVVGFRFFDMAPFAERAAPRGPVDQGSRSGPASPGASTPDGLEARPSPWL